MPTQNAYDPVTGPLVKAPPQNTIGAMLPNGTTAGGLVGNIRPPVADVNGAQLNGNVYANYGGGLNGPRHAGRPVGGNTIGDFQAQIDSAWDAQKRRLDPMFAQREADLEQRLIDQGIRPGSPAYETAMRNSRLDRSDAYNSAGYGAQQAGLTAYDTLTQHDLTREGHNTSRDVARIGAAAQTGAAGIAANSRNYAADLQNNQFMHGLNQRNYEFDVNDIFRTNQQDINAGLGYGQLGLQQNQQQLNAWNANQNAANNNFNQIGSIFGMVPGYTGFNAATGLPQAALDSSIAGQQNNQNMWGTIGSLIGTGASAYYSSEMFKQMGPEVDPELMLKAVNDMTVTEWQYNDDSPSNDRDLHIGTTAEKFNEALGLGDKKYISIIDSLGAITGAIQALTKRLEVVENGNR